jgi:GDP-4-dehydro-6-deoxy-D-mannose reductase
LQIVRVRPFNHIGPGQSPNFVVATFAKKIAEIEKNKKEGVMKVGNLEAKRDFTDVRDMVKAYSLAMSKGLAGQAYNVGSGYSYKISDILEKLLSLSKVKIEVEVDKSLFRPIDNPELLCDAAKFKKLTGWEPEIGIDVTLKDTLDYWRNII